jgi:exopolysaccharide biosynthesis polyprenyl glycosylphosphotransferase
MIVDAAALAGAGMLAAWVRFGSVGVAAALENTRLVLDFWQISIIAAPLFMVFLGLEGLYDPRFLSGNPGQVSRVTRGLGFGVVALIVVTYLLKWPGLSRGWLVLFVVFAAGLIVLGRGSAYLGQTAAWARGHSTAPTLIVGTNSEASDIIRILRANPGAGLVPVGCVASSQAERLELDFCSEDVPCLGATRDLASIIAQNPPDTVIIASSAFDHEVLARVLAELRTEDMDVHVSSGLFEVMTSRVLVNEVAGIPLITVRQVVMSRGQLALKRAFDLVVAGMVAILGLPIWLLIALLVKLSSPGPVLFRQARVGREGREFGMLKFRTMRADAEDRLGDLHAENEASGPLFKMKDDPRVTLVGRWLRKFSIDEIPQVINVIRGEMSIVGPRPPLPREVEAYTDHHWRRLEVVPGMTGLWQVSGRSSLTFDEMVRLDLFYIENWSVGLDIALILRTVPAVLFAHGAY